MSRANTQILPLKVVFYGDGEVLSSIALSSSPSFDYVAHTSPQLQAQIAIWLKHYMHGTTPHTLLPLTLSHLPPFTQKVLKAIQSIPFGETATYHFIATQAGNSKACRAVGNICHRNPYPLVIPCHRIIQSSGKLGGFAFTSELKASLLAFEEKTKKSSIPPSKYN